MVDKVHASGTRESHLPAGRQGAKLRDGLGLDGEVVPVRTHDSQELLPPRIDPGRRTSAIIIE